MLTSFVYDNPVSVRVTFVEYANQLFCGKKLGNCILSTAFARTFVHIVIIVINRFRIGLVSVRHCARL